MIFLGADHGGFALKEQLKQWLQEWKMPFSDLGALAYDEADDYPTFALAVAEAVRGDSAHRGILACRSAAGVIIAANKVRAIRAVAPVTPLAAQHAREHNDANVLGLSGDWLTTEQAKTIVHTWLTTPFSQEERHARRLQHIAAYEQSHWK